MNFLECLDVWILDEHINALNGVMEFMKFYSKNNNIDAIMYYTFMEEFDGIFKKSKLFQEKSLNIKSFYRLGKDVKGHFTSKNSYLVRLQGDAYL